MKAKDLEKILVKKSTEGDNDAFRQLVEPVYQGLTNLAKKMTKCDADAEDAVQRAVLQAHKKLSTFQHTSSFRNWIYVITANTCRNLVRERKWKMHVSIDFVDESLLQDRRDPLEAYNRELIMCLLQNEISKLPPRQRQIMNLYLKDSLSLRQISEKLNCPYETAKANFRHGFLKIKESILDRQLSLDDFL